jgi:hypothetical protein
VYADNLIPIIRPVPYFCSGATISRAVPRFFNVRDPRISIDRQLREASPQLYKSWTKEKTTMLQDQSSPIWSVALSN